MNLVAAMADVSRPRSGVTTRMTATTQATKATIVTVMLLVANVANTK